MVERIREEMDDQPFILATGGLAPLIGNISKTIEQVDGSLTLEGLRIIHNHLNR
jgi:type III pantothenate kinase